MGVTGAGKATLRRIREVVCTRIRGGQIGVGVGGVGWGSGSRAEHRGTRGGGHPPSQLSCGLINYSSQVLLIGNLSMRRDGKGACLALVGKEKRLRVTK